MVQFSGSIATNGTRVTYLVSLTAGVTYFFEMEGAATGFGSLLDPFVRAIGPTGLLVGDDDGGVGLNARLVFTPTIAGNYTVFAGEAGDNGTGTYRLTVEADDFRGTSEGNGSAGALSVGAAGATGTINYIGDRDMFAVTLTAGTQYFIDLEGTPTTQGTLADAFLRGVHDAAGTLLSGTVDDDGGVGANSRAVFTPTTTGSYFISAGGYFNEIGTYRVFVRPDDWRSTADGIGPSGLVAINSLGSTGNINYVGDQDIFRVTLAAGTQYYIDLEGVPTNQGTLVDGFLRGIYDPAGALLANTVDDDGGVGRNARVVFTPTVTGSYMVAAGGFDTNLGSYRLFARADDFRSTFEGVGSAGSVALGAVGATGTINYVGDQDLFSVDLTLGTQYFVELEGAPSGQGTLGDSFLRGIYNSAGTLLPSSGDDDGGVGANSRVVFTPTTTGTFFVAAGGYSTYTGTYRLKVGADDFRSTYDGIGSSGLATVNGAGATGNINFADDLDLFRVTLAAGTQYYIDLEGSPSGQGTIADTFLRGIFNTSGILINGLSDDNGGVGANSRVVFTPTVAGTYSIAAGAAGGGTGTYKLNVRADDHRSTFEGSGLVGFLSVGTAGHAGTINYAGDQDLFVVTLDGGTQYFIDLEGSPTSRGTLSDPYLRGIYDFNGTLLPSSLDDDGGSGNNARVVFTPTTTSVYFIAAGALGGGTGTYQLFANPDDFRDHQDGIGPVGTATIGATTKGSIDYIADADLFGVTLTANHLYRIEQRGAPSGSGTLGDPLITGVYNSNRVLQPNSSNDDSGGTRNASVEFLAPTTGLYYIGASAYASHVGTYELRVTNLAGPEIGDTTATTGTIAVDGVVRGLIDKAGDVDWYRVNFTVGASYSIEQTSIGDSGNPVGDTFFRGVYNSVGVRIANTTNDDWAGTSDSRVVFTPRTAGTYFIAAGAYGTNTGEYRLSLSSTTVTDLIDDTTATTGTLALGSPVTGDVEFSRDLDWYRVTLTAGVTYRIREQGAASNNGTLADPRITGVYDSAGVLFAGSSNDSADGSLDSRVLFTPDTTGTYYVSAGGYYDTIGTYRLSIEVDAAAQEVPDNVSSKATVAVNGTLNGIINASEDTDWIGFDAVAGTTYRVSLAGVGTGGSTLVDPVLGGVFTPSRLAVPNSGNDDFNGSKDAQITFTAAETGRHFIVAEAYKDGTGTYQVGVSKVSDNTAPTLLFRTPGDITDSGLTAVDRNISLNFNEAVKAGQGKFVLTGGGQTREISVTDTTQVTFLGEIVTINPTTDLAPSTKYSLTAASGVVTDLSGNAYAGLTTPTDLTFTTRSTSILDNWTLMVYIAGDNNLEGAGVEDVNEMESLNLPSNVNLMVLFDRVGGWSTASGNWTDTRGGQIMFDSQNDTNNNTIVSPLLSQGELNMGSPSTLTGFINWAAATAPAQNYGLIMWDHGGGISGHSWDDTSRGDNLTILETRQAIAASDVGKFSLIGFDECFMAVAEETFDLRDRTDIIVSSQEWEPGDGWEYHKFLAPLAANPTMSAMDLAGHIVSTYGERYAGEADITLSSVWTAGLGALGTALDSFCLEALAPVTTAADWAGLREAAERAYHFDADDIVDLRDFMLEVGNRVTSAPLRTAAANVAARVGDAVTATTGTVGDAAGISIYLPYGATTVDPTYTPANFNFLNDVPNWDNFLAKL